MCVPLNDQLYSTLDFLAINLQEPEKHVFHLVTDKLNFGAMNMWFLLNPPGDATIHVENVDDFKWLNSSYCPVLRQLESAAMREYYFKAGPKTLSAGSSNLKYRTTTTTKPLSPKQVRIG